MGDPTGDSAQDRYAAIERLYSQGRWSEVLEACASLLAALPDQPGDPLQTRLTLLQGHTQLYGFGQVEAAAAIYQQVLESPAEPLLKTIAAQELERCRQPQAVAPAAGASEADAVSRAAADDAPQPQPSLSPEVLFTPQAVDTAESLQPPAAMPWLAALGGVDPVASATATAAAAAVPAAAAPWLETTAPAATQTPSDTDPAATEKPLLTAAPAADYPAPTETPEPQETASADVIDEPDQIVVHQADPKRSETVDLTPLEAATATSRWSPADEAELARGLLRVVLR